MNKAIEIWNSLDLSNQTNLECARAWFIEGFAHGQKVKTLTDDEIEKVRIAIIGTAYWCADENMSEAYNAVKVCCSEVLAILRKAQEK